VTHHGAALDAAGVQHFPHGIMWTDMFASYVQYNFGECKSFSGKIAEVTAL